MRGRVRTARETRTEVAGSTKKMYRQKGTGRARAGSRRSGIRRGGGHIFALRPRDYSYRLPRKAVRAATRMAIVSKIQSGDLLVIDELAFAQPKTKDMFAVLQALKLNGTSTLVATAAYDINVLKSARNIDRVTVASVSDLNALTVLASARADDESGAGRAVPEGCRTASCVTRPAIRRWLRGPGRLH